MIFNTETTTATNWDAVQESPYALGLEGALMHVYENECNYNALIKAAGLSELKYFKETGNSLFVHEAGAFSNFIEKAKAFFKAVIEKIKAMFKKFFMMINSVTMDNKKFVKKYQKDLLKVDLTDFEFEGYEFTGIEKGFKINYDVISRDADQIEKAGRADAHNIDNYADNDAVTAECEKRRGALINKGSMDEDEFREELHDILWGNKVTLENINMRSVLTTLENGDKLIKDAEKEQKEIEKNLNKVISALEKCQKTIINTKVDAGSDEAKLADTRIKVINDKINITKCSSNDATILCGMWVQAMKDVLKQCKSICVKAISYKHESATLESANDIFAGVQII